MATCPDCFETVLDDARRCRACGRWLRDCRQCPQCGETVLAVARVCRFCGYDLVADPLSCPQPLPSLEGLPHTLAATPLGGMVCESSVTALFLPPRMTIRENEIVVTKWSWLGLRTYEQKVALAKVASVRLLIGVIWAGLLVETFGGSVAALSLSGLDKAEAQQTVSLIEKLTQASRQLRASTLK
ncbi:zinc ribbon domain-containing protein [Candidatus Sumerlaeota bacterium]|nr:zinc ribbon domain-containing protein [Candidatus Sumerlaeota bacterium]